MVATKHTEMMIDPKTFQGLSKLEPNEQDRCGRKPDCWLTP